MDLCWNVPTLGKFSEKFPCKATIHSCFENGVTHDLPFVERPQQILCCNCNGFLQQKGLNFFLQDMLVCDWWCSYFYYERESYHIVHLNMNRLVLEHLSGSYRTKCAAFNSRIFMCMSDSCLLYDLLLAGLSLKRRHNNSYSLPSHVKWNTEIGILAF